MWQTFGNTDYWKASKIVITVTMRFGNFEIQNVPFKTPSNNNHVLRHKNEARSGPVPRVINSPTLPRDSQVKVTPVSKLLGVSCVGANSVYTRAERVCSFPNTILHRNRVPLFAKHSAMHTWQGNLWTHKCLSVTRAHRATKQLKLRPYWCHAATRYGCEKPALPLACHFARVAVHV
jgi:hypothetical protein